MSTDPFVAAARALGADPAEVRESMRNATEHAERNGMPDEEFVLWVWHAGAVWARGMEAARAAQEPTDGEVMVAMTAYEGHPDRVSAWRAALSAAWSARAARRDEKDRP